MIDELPKGWASSELERISEINPRHPKGLGDDIPVTFVPMAALSESKPEFEFTEERPLGEVRKGFTHFAERDVLFAKITPCMENGKGAVARGLRNMLGCATTEVHVVRPLADISPDYIYRFLAQRSVRREAKEHFTGSAGQARVPKSFIEEIEIPVPPLAEQMRIVAKLEKLSGQVDVCQQRLAKISALLKRFRQSVLAAACSGRLTADWREANSAKAVESAEDLPDGWSLASVGDVLESLKYGTATKCGYERLGVPVLRIPNVVSGKVDHADLKFAELPAKELSQLRLTSGDILLIRSNGSVSLVGRTAIVSEEEKDFAYAGYLIRLRPNRAKVRPDFLNLVLASYDIRLQIELEARSTSGVNNINTEEVKALRFQLPLLAEQQEIVSRVERLFALADRLEARFTAGRKQVNSITQAILAKAFRGELVPTEFELSKAEGRSFETAEKLLERIGRNGEPKRKKERATATPTKTRSSMPPNKPHSKPHSR
jgi:type I restriction enzyme S subunit